MKLLVLCFIGTISMICCQITVKKFDLSQRDHEIQQLCQMVGVLKEKVEKLEKRNTENNDAGGVTFVHWGRNKCDENSSMIYTEYGAKNVLTSTGGGTNYQCLPKNPEWTGNEKAGLQLNSYIYGVEYWANGVPYIFSDHDRFKGFPCCVCEVQNFSNSLMIPAKVSCPDSWTIQYTGILMAERYNHVSASNHICVNRQFEFVDNSGGNQDSGYVIPVEVVCGALPCPPYENGYELSCVVCTK